MVDGVAVEQVGGNDNLDNFLKEVLAELFVGDLLVVLGADNDGMNANRHASAVFQPVFDGDLTT